MVNCTVDWPLYNKEHVHEMLSSSVTDFLFLITDAHSNVYSRQRSVRSQHELCETPPFCFSPTLCVSVREMLFVVVVVFTVTQKISANVLLNQPQHLLQLVHV